MNTFIETIVTEHNLVLSSFVVSELKKVVDRKFSNKIKDIDFLLSTLSFEFVYTPQEMKRGLFQIRDDFDYPVLYTAIIEDIDVFITGDKDFSDVKIMRPEIMTITQFLDKYTD